MIAFKMKTLGTALLALSVIACATPSEKHSGQIDPVIAERAGIAERMSGVWKGTFRRYDSDGILQETLPSEIHVRFPTDHPDYDYHQTNILTMADGGEQRIESYGSWDGSVLRFANDRVEGIFRELTEDPSRRTSTLFMRFAGPVDMTLSETITLSPDENTRARTAQMMRGGVIVRRTHVDERRVRSTAPGK